MSCTENKILNKSEFFLAEILFLEEIDPYRFNKFFFIPLLEMFFEDFSNSEDLLLSFGIEKVGKSGTAYISGASSLTKYVYLEILLSDFFRKDNIFQEVIHKIMRNYKFDGFVWFDFKERSFNNDALNTALLHKDLKCKAPLIEPNLRRNLGKWST